MTDAAQRRYTRLAVVDTPIASIIKIFAALLSVADVGALSSKRQVLSVADNFTAVSSTVFVIRAFA